MNATDCIDRISAAIADHEGGGSGEDEVLRVVADAIGEFMNQYYQHYRIPAWPIPDHGLVRQAVARSHGMRTRDPRS